MLFVSENIVIYGLNCILLVLASVVACYANDFKRDEMKVHPKMPFVDSTGEVEIGTYSKVLSYSNFFCGLYYWQFWSSLDFKS